jgi:hypothetical protein
VARQAPAIVDAMPALQELTPLAEFLASDDRFASFPGGSRYALKVLRGVPRMW